ncbi:hypothetical protein [Stutzerimonas kunmingensis]|uniref:hypothetical protein n=1 Tax=Stutzerimonas kunmingensis TaxID=1211807 RepID=UPI000CE330F2|nr:hypothetical protein [Stutzerimonas kunmingensis]
MHTDKAIAEFEAWWDRQPFRDQFEDVKDQMRNVWLASRRDLVVTIEPGDCFSPNDCGDLAIWRDDAKRLLEAAGVTVRG